MVTATLSPTRPSSVPEIVGVHPVHSCRVRQLIFSFGFEQQETDEAVFERLFAELESKAGLGDTSDTKRRTFSPEQNQAFARRQVHTRKYDRVLVVLGDILHGLCGGDDMLRHREFEGDEVPLGTYPRTPFQRIVTPFRPTFEVEFDSDGIVTLRGTIGPRDANVTDEALHGFIADFKTALERWKYMGVSSRDFQGRIESFDMLTSDRCSSATAYFSGSDLRNKVNKLKGWKSKPAFLVELFWRKNPETNLGEYTARPGTYSYRCDFTSNDPDGTEIESLFRDLIEAVKVPGCGRDSDDFRMGSPIFVVLRNDAGEAVACSVRNPNSKG
jgi:hypothetical protein